MRKITVNIPPVSERAEFPIIFILLFLPSYLNQQSLPLAPFDSPSFMMQSILQSMLVFFLIRYLMQLRPAVAGNRTVVTSALSPQINVKHSLIVLAGLLGMHALYSFLVIPFLLSAGFMEHPAEPLLISRGIMLLPALFTCFAAAVMEEFFFRGYAFFRIEESGLERVPALLLVNLIFAVGHLYEGIPAACFALFSGIFLSVLVLKKVSLFSLAAAHGIFNFIMILLSFLRHINL